MKCSIIAASKRRCYPPDRLWDMKIYLAGDLEPVINSVTGAIDKRCIAACRTTVI